MTTSTTISIGQELTHARFGTGTVVAYDGFKVVINFATVGTKELIAQFAKFAEIDPTSIVAAAPSVPEQPKFAKMVAASAKKQRRREREAAELARHNALPNLKKIQHSLTGCNGLVQGNRHSLHWQMIDELILKIQVMAEENADTFIADVCQSVRKYMRCSDKQAFVMARFADANGIQD